MNSILDEKIRQMVKEATKEMRRIEDFILYQDSYYKYYLQLGKLNSCLRDTLKAGKLNEE